jgi:hypothetical protein
MKHHIAAVFALLMGLGVAFAESVVQPRDRSAWPAGCRFTFSYSPAQGIGPEQGVMRRDPSDIIKVGEMYYAWYTKGKVAHGYDATVWYATSTDGHKWTEKGETLARGPKGAWDEQSAFTPNILVAGGKYWLFYTGVPKPFVGNGNKVTKTAIGAAVADSPDGPWRKLNTNPVLRTSEDPNAYDSMRVDDACLIVRDGKCWLYYKGRKWDDDWKNTKMGVAIGEHPAGPYIKYKANPVVGGGHEVLVWPQGKGVMSMTSIGPPGIAKTLRYAEDGLNFVRVADLEDLPYAPGAYRPEAFTGSGKGELIEWGLYTGNNKGMLPYLGRFDCQTQSGSTTKPATSSRTVQP